MKRELALASCPAVTVSESALQVPRLNRRMVRARPDTVSGGLAGSGAVLSYTPEELWLMEAGCLDICFG